MQELADKELLRRYAEEGSEEAFAILVRRYLNIVHSAAVRKTGNSHAAEEISQAVFIILAEKAATLSPYTILSGWLYQATRLAAQNYLRQEVRRAHREQEAYMQSQTEETVSNVWSEISPHLDDAIGELSARDRDVVALRFFEGKSFSDVGIALGDSENAVKKRVGRALDKLRKCLLKRGVVSTVALIAGAVSANSVQAAPQTLAETIAAGAITKGAAASTSTISLVKGALKLMAWAKMKAAVLVGIVLLAVGTGTVITSQVLGRDREAHQILERVKERYASLSSYSSVGETEQVIGKETAAKTLTGTFTMRLGRTNLYLIEYEQKGTTLTNKGAVWSDGTGDYFANDRAGQTNKIHHFENDLRRFKRGLGMSSGMPRNYLGDIANVSGGVTAIVPGAFFETPIPDGSEKGAFYELLQVPLWRTTRVFKEPDERIGEVDCYVLSAATERGTTLLWIGKEDLLIHQSQQRVNLVMADYTDAETSELGVTSQGPLPLPIREMTRRINEGRKKAAATGKPVTVVFSEAEGPGLKSVTFQPPGKSIYTQRHHNIRVNEPFKIADFAR